MSLSSSRTLGFRWSQLPDLLHISERHELFRLDFGSLKRQELDQRAVKMRTKLDLSSLPWEMKIKGEGSSYVYLYSRNNIGLSIVQVYSARPIYSSYSYDVQR